MKDDRVYLEHILESIRRLEENTKDGRNAFLASHTIQDAALRNLQTMTEATQRLSEALRSTHPEIEWRRLGAFRNILVHNYLGIDVELVWLVIERDVPVLKTAVRAMIDGV